jgi:hypothetical protein
VRLDKALAALHESEAHTQLKSPHQTMTI